MKLQSVAALVLSVAATGAHAGAWSVSSTSAAPGNAATIAVSFTGDGQSKAAEVTISFDHGRLSLPVTSGPITGAGANGAGCVRMSETTIKVAKSDFASVLSGTPTTFCNIPFTVRNPAAPGQAPIIATQPACFTDTAPHTPCTASSGAVTVTGTASGAPPTAPRPNRLYVLLSADEGAPTMEDIVSVDFASGLNGPPLPLSALSVESPTAAWPLLPFRATGDFAAHLAQYPDTARARLERYFVIEYPEGADLEAATDAFEEEEHVSAVFEDASVEMATPPASTPEPKSVVQPNDVANQYHLAALNAPPAWNLASGWSLLGFLDNGLRVAHSDLRSFTGANSESGSYAGGNYLPVYAYDYGLHPSYSDRDVDEASLSPATLPSDTNCDPESDGLLQPVDAGHGTSVASTAAGNPSNGDIADGVCPHCGIAMIKISKPYCNRATPQDPWRVYLDFPLGVIEPSFALLNDFGMQVISMSFGLTDRRRLRHALAPS